jgi:hypothetical protein
LSVEGDVELRPGCLREKQREDKEQQGMAEGRSRRGMWSSGGGVWSGGGASSTGELQP